MQRFARICFRDSSSSAAQTHSLAVFSCSPYILFSISKMQELKHLCKNTTKVTNFSSQISKEWKALSAREREKWKIMAEEDKLRYDAEKRNYTGPWVVRSDSTRKVWYDRSLWSFNQLNLSDLFSQPILDLMTNGHRNDPRTHQSDPLLPS